MVNKNVEKMENLQNQNSELKSINSFDVSQLNYQDLLNNAGVLKTHTQSNTDDINPLQKTARKKKMKHLEIIKVL